MSRSENIKGLLAVLWFPTGIYLLSLVVLILRTWIHYGAMPSMTNNPWGIGMEVNRWVAIYALIVSIFTAGLSLLIVLLVKVGVLRALLERVYVFTAVALACLVALSVWTKFSYWLMG